MGGEIEDESISGYMAILMENVSSKVAHFSPRDQDWGKALLSQRYSLLQSDHVQRGSQPTGLPASPSHNHIAVALQMLVSGPLSQVAQFFPMILPPSAPPSNCSSLRVLLPPNAPPSQYSSLPMLLIKRYLLLNCPL